MHFEGCMWDRDQEIILKTTATILFGMCQCTGLGVYLQKLVLIWEIPMDPEAEIDWTPQDALKILNNYRVHGKIVFKRKKNAYAALLEFADDITFQFPEIEVGANYMNSDYQDNYHRLWISEKPPLLF